MHNINSVYYFYLQTHICKLQVAYRSNRKSLFPQLPVYSLKAPQTSGFMIQCPIIDSCVVTDEPRPTSGFIGLVNRWGVLQNKIEHADARAHTRALARGSGCGQPIITTSDRIRVVAARASYLGHLRRRSVRRLVGHMTQKPSSSAGVTPVRSIGSLIVVLVQPLRDRGSIIADRWPDQMEAPCSSSSLSSSSSIQQQTE